MGVFSPATRRLLEHERRVRRRLTEELGERPAESTEGSSDLSDSDVDRLFGEVLRFAEAHPEFERAWFRRLRWRLERIDAGICAARHYLRRRVLARHSSSPVWFVMHTSTETQIHWQCPDCDYENRCDDPDTNHLCTAGIVFDVTSVERTGLPDPLIRCHFCGREAPGNPA
jgi:hypothetical protein